MRLNDELTPSQKIYMDIPLEQVPISDSARVAEMFLDAFAENKIARFLSAKSKDGEDAVEENFRLAVERAYVNGVVFRTSKKFEGAAVWFLNGFAKSNLLINMRILRFMLGQFRLRDISKLTQFYLQVERAHKRIMRRPHYYLELLGVGRRFQGQGFGSYLMKPVLAHADQNRKCCYLETQTSKNVAMYEHFGFKVTDTIPSPISNGTYYLMLRKPKSGK
jgi:ribosomal protein S18 acetylase RimI-like enzyme